MRFLGVEHDLARCGWDNAEIPLLWRYNQHYFDDLNACGHEARRAWHEALVERWLNENPPGKGTAWAPYPTSLRIVNWIKWFMALPAGQTPRQHWLQSLAVQAEWLTGCIEWHLLGNHLFSNAKALVLAGLYLEGPQAERWLGKGLAILERELPEQILADGGHFERSPMYHALALEDVLDLVNALRVYRPQHAILPRLHRHAAVMLHWLRCLRHPDGTLARFNDCAEGIAPPADEIERYASALGIACSASSSLTGVIHLPESGYLRLARGAAVAMLDVAPVGPDYLPGHAHADTLSFELSVSGRALIVNRGTSVYGEGPRRQLERGTSAHSTVQVGCHDSSEVWAGFRVGRRARPGPVDIDDWSVRASHDGYRYLSGAPEHHRRWLLSETSLEVDDSLQPRPAEPARARYHLAPGLEAKPLTDRLWSVGEHGREVAQAQVLAGEAALEDWQHAQRFGELVPARTLVVRAASGQARVRWAWGA